MKSIKLFTVISLLAIATSASAQFSSSKGSATSTSSEGWSTFWFEWNPTKIKYDVKNADDASATGLSIGFSQAFGIAPGTPLFLELGLGIQYTFGKEDTGIDLDDLYYYDYSRSTRGGYSDDYDDDDIEIKTTLFSAKVPVNLIYAFQLPNSSVTLMPFVGANLRYNFSGKQKLSFEGDEDYDDDDLEWDVFDKKDMGSEKKTWKRFQIGWNVGLKARLGENFLVGVSYGKDFSEISKKAKIQTTSLSLGYTF